MSCPVWIVQYEKANYFFVGKPKLDNNGSHETNNYRVVENGVCSYDFRLFAPSQNKLALCLIGKRMSQVEVAECREWRNAGKIFLL